MGQEMIIIGTQGNPAEVTPNGALKVDIVIEDTSGLAQESTLSTVNSNLIDIEKNTDPNARILQTLRPSGSGTIADRIYRGSVANVGTADGTFNGTVIKPGEILPINPGEGSNNYFAINTISYDASATEFLIEYTTD